jgi:hypothetical protein
MRRPNFLVFNVKVTLSTRGDLTKDSIFLIALITQIQQERCTGESLIAKSLEVVIHLFQVHVSALSAFCASLCNTLAFAIHFHCRLHVICD